MGSIVVRGLAVGEGRPKICVPLVGADLAALEVEARLVGATMPDLVEWRVDFFPRRSDPAALGEALGVLRRLLPQTPLLFTCRTVREGGEGNEDADAYAELNRAACDSGLIDLVDVELFTPETARGRVLARARELGVFSIVSNHDFHSTPPETAMVERLVAAARIGDVAKIAVMPRGSEDVARLLLATAQAKKETGGVPLVSMSMGALGAVSRLAGEFFGSAITFGTVKAASAPGQMPIDRLRAALDIVHEAVSAGKV